MIGSGAFGWLPWLTMDSSTAALLQTRVEELAPLLAQCGDEQVLGAILQEQLATMLQTPLTGWWFLLVAPGVSTVLWVMLTLMVASWYTALISGACAAIESQYTCFLGGVLLIFSGTALIVLGGGWFVLVYLDMGMLWFLLRAAGVQVGSGAWWSIVALGMSVLGGVLSLRDCA